MERTPWKIPLYLPGERTNFQYGDGDDSPPTGWSHGAAKEQAADKVITADEFESLSPYERGYVVYMAGHRADQPVVPDEKCPYKSGSHKETEWIRGRETATSDIAFMVHRGFRGPWE